MTALPIAVCKVPTPDGVRHYVTCLPTATVFAHGLPPEAIVGVVAREPREGESIRPEEFARNRAFVDFLHGVVARRGPDTPGLIAEAKRQGDGFVYVLDQRTRDPHGRVPPEDIVGVFAVQQGVAVPGSYQANPNHRVLSANGFVRLGAELQACLLDELERLAANQFPAGGGREPPK